MTNYIGKAVKRVEDKRFLTGKGRYTDDIVLPGMLYAYIVRSPYAHAKINNLDTSRAEKMDGVVKIYTGKDIADSGINGIPTGWQVNFKNGDTMKEPPHPLLVADKARYMGDGVAVVIAESREEARDAADEIDIDWEELPAVANAKKATEDGAPLVHDEAPNNKCFDWELGNPKEEVDKAMKQAHHITTLEFTNQRVIPNAMETRAAIGQYEEATGKYTLYTTSQNPHLTRLLLCAFVLGIPEHRVRVVAPDVGGGFGSKIFHYAEEALMIWCSERLKRPVKWTSDRSEAFMTDAHGRDHISKAEMGFDKEGNVLALRVKTHANLGAYLSTFAPCVPTWLHGTLMQGLYVTPKINVDVTGVFTNTVMVDAYRGAGRPEATYLLERLMDTAALEMDMDPAELRLKNFIPPFDGVEQPGYQTQVALQYDSGNYHAVLKRALEMVGYEKFRKEQAEARKEGKLLGIGFSTYIEACGIAPSAVVGALGARAGLYEVGQVRVQPTGKVSVFTGAHSHGQGHETTFAQVVADRLGIPLDDVEIIHGDSDSVAFGMGTYGSRSLAVGGSAIVKSLDKIIEKGAKIAAHKLEAAEEDLEFAEGKWTVKGTDKGIAFGDVALTAYVPHDYPEGVEPGMDFSSFYDPANFTYPYGAHVAIVEVDKDTGHTKLKRFIAVDDVGNVINPMIVDGQIHGGLAQGIGQALFEGAMYDEDGQLINGSYMDYTMPRADDLPSFEIDRTVTPCPHNPLGVKGAGEAGCIGSTPAVVNAVMDALRPFGIKKDLEMPLTPERVWRHMQS
ncbi:xanthine dehydrogenase family protein molybdopterin-binding subunit [Phaeodactylibacter sp.]|uniref:xanthine dehydrogenase family protein molybdopterin-binding subunit n=1 Tax=Phaeodactylibacter sp. TaxID=1940289 RepID=UPI0025D082FD|nr:xanthine dehydrogenase family protein molybdopterin-binding subunit [Phaeodactylibacter sp.]MCI4649506.1 xanthine dehydrogenase family protein molybdopterin-binding subunit [Phaeodactylibacter sp.]MCI5094357.1 xanthine dehydrogenase family protein molybdopterin-binding subunit [Phaeodactylibacter sp.]